MKAMGGFTRGVVVLLVLTFTALSAVALAAPAQDLAVCNAGTSKLVRVSTTGNNNPEVLAAFTSPCFDVKVLDATTTYVSIPGNNTVEAVNVITKTATSIPTGTGPQKMVLNAASTRLYVATSTNVTVINTVTNTVVPAENIELSVYGGSAYSATLVPPIVTGSTQPLLAIGTKNGQALLFNISGVPVFVGNLTFGTTVSDLSFSPDGIKLYMAMTTITNNFDASGNPIFGNFFIAQVATINRTTNVVQSGLNLGNGSQLASMVPDGTNLIITGTTFGEMYTVDTKNDALFDTLPVGGNPFSITFSGNIYMSNPTLDVIQIVRRGTLNTIQLPSGSAPTGIAVIPTRKGKGKP